jgi:hypothetical protein
LTRKEMVMMVKLKAAAAAPEWMHGLDEEQIAFYQQLSRAQAACRAKRRHNFHFDDLDDEAVLEDVEIVLLPAGVCQLRDYCQRGCGRYIEYLTGRSGAIDWDTARYGGVVAGYMATGLGLTASDDRLFWRYLQQERITEEIQRFMRKAGKTRTVATGGKT